VLPPTIRVSRNNSDEQAARRRGLALRLRRKCSVPWCRRHATKILRFLDNQGRPYRQNVVCKTHAQEMCVGMKVTERTD
jgi:hypothetical protein